MEPRFIRNCQGTTETGLLYRGSTTTTIVINTIQVQKRRKRKKNYRKRKDRRYITICTIFESVCNSQSSEAFELAAAYLQVKKERGKQIIIKTKLIHQARSVMKMEWRCYIKNYLFGAEEHYLLYRGLCYIEVRLIEVPLYHSCITHHPFLF